MSDYSSKDFEEVVAFSVSEPGAMGPNQYGPDPLGQTIYPFQAGNNFNRPY